jgi:hypothetical protein
MWHLRSAKGVMWLSAIWPPFRVVHLIVCRQLGTEKPKLRPTVVGVFIANEENATDLGIGVDALVAKGMLDKLKGGPL